MRWTRCGLLSAQVGVVALVFDGKRSEPHQLRDLEQGVVREVVPEQEGRPVHVFPDRAVTGIEMMALDCL